MFAAIGWGHSSSSHSGDQDVRDLVRQLKTFEEGICACSKSLRFRLCSGSWPPPPKALSSTKIKPKCLSFLQAWVEDKIFDWIVATRSHERGSVSMHIFRNVHIFRYLKELHSSGVMGVLRASPKQAFYNFPGSCFSGMHCVLQEHVRKHRHLVLILD